MPSPHCNCDVCQPVRVFSVAIIGAGPLGLAALKCCLDENTFSRVVCFEVSADIGGVWRYDGLTLAELRAMEESQRVPASSSAYASLRTNTSLRMMGFSDFPADQTSQHETTRFATHQEIIEYLERFADAFSLRSFLQLQTRVRSLERSGNEWLLTLERYSKQGSHIEQQRFDAIIVATGQFSEPIYATIPRECAFTGVELHAHHYRSPAVSLYAATSSEPLHVVLIGNGNSCGDIALELAREPQERIASVTVAMRSGHYIVDLSTSKSNARAFDEALFTRYFAKPQFRSQRRSFFEQHVGRAHEPFVERGFPKPSEPLDRGFITHIKEPIAWLAALDARRIVVSAPIRAVVRECEIELTNGQRRKCDVIIHCTGYTRRTALLQGELKVNNLPMRVDLYRHVMHANYSTLAVLGQIESNGSVFCVGEMQARWLARVWSGHVKVPCTNERREWLQQWHAKVDRIQPPFPMFVDWLSYLDSFAREIGCMPHFEPNDALAPLLDHGTNFPAVYRLTGPNAWSNAASYLAAKL